MDIFRAKEILELLADGVNPTTGELLHESDSCNQAEVVRALHTAIRYLNANAEKAQKPQPGNGGKPWTAEDEEILCKMFDSGCTKKEMANHFQRSQGAIAARLVRLRRIKERTDLK